MGSAGDLLAVAHLLESGLDLLDAPLLLLAKEVEVFVQEHLVVLSEVSQQLGPLSWVLHSRVTGLPGWPRRTYDHDWRWRVLNL